MIDLKKYLYIDTTLETVLTHDFEILKRSFDINYKCRVCNILLFYYGSMTNDEKIYTLFDNYHNVNITCHEMVIKNILL